MTWRNWWRGLVTRVSNGVKDLVQAHWLCTLKETKIFEFLLGWAMRIWTIQYGSDILACVEFRSRSRCVCRSRILSGEGSRKAGLGTYLTCTFLQYCNVFSIGGIYFKRNRNVPIVERSDTCGDSGRQKNAAIGGAVTGALLSFGDGNFSRDKLVQHAITGGAIATASEFIRNLI